METSLDCFVSVNGQDPALKTYAEIDGTLLINQEGEFFGKTIDGELTVVRDLVGACLNTSQGVRVTITIAGQDVSDSIVGHIAIAHNLNYISTFAFQLGDPKYSPLTYAYIDINDIVVITVYINRQEFKIFTGLVDRTYTSHSESGYVLNVTGRGYGKKLLNKTMTLISVQEAADNPYRGSIVKYLAEQAGITNVDVPAGDKVNIDHSFQDQSIWNMIQKECAIEGWYVRFDENGVMKVKTRTIKTNVSNYPVVDWNYGEDKFDRVGLETSDMGIINKVTILGAIFEEKTIIIHEHEVSQHEVPPCEPVYDEQTITINKSFTAGEVVTNWSYEDANFRVTAKYLGYTKPSGYIFPKYQDYSFTVTLLNNDLDIQNVAFTITGGASKYWEGNRGCNVHREITSTLDWDFTEKAFTISIVIKTKEQTDGGIEQYEEENPSETFEEVITYTQVKATVTDAASIALYGERKPNNEGTLPFPLAETEEQCKRIGENIILDSHRFIEQPDLEANYNPLFIVGHYVELDDKKLGYSSSRYLGEEAIHTIDINPQSGAIKVRTRIGCVIYA